MIYDYNFKIYKNKYKFIYIKLIDSLTICKIYYWILINIIVMIYIILLN